MADVVRTERNLLFDALRFSENCLCLDFMLADDKPPLLGVQALFAGWALIGQKAVSDAIHIAMAAVHEMHFLLTWNCTHIATAEMSGAIEAAGEAAGFSCPVICTPEELTGL